MTDFSPIHDGEQDDEPIYGFGECECGFYAEEDDEGRIRDTAHCCECGASGTAWEYDPCSCPGQ